MTRVTLNEASQSIWQANNLEHLRYEYDLQPTDTVIDLGAYRGEWANEIRHRYGCTPIVVEPTDAIDGYDGEIIKRAAWDYSGALAMGGAFYYTSAYEESTGGYSCFDVNDMLAQHTEIALLKINIEGCEYRLLDHIINHGYHQRIRNLQVQFHIIEGQPWQAWYDGIADKLSVSHYPAWRYPFCWESWRIKGEARC